MIIMITPLGESENYKYLEILEADTIQQTEKKEKNRKEYLRKIKLKSTSAK